MRQYQASGVDAVLSAWTSLTSSGPQPARFIALEPDLKALLNGMLSIYPAQRLTIGQVAASPWLAGAVPTPAAPAPAPAPVGRPRRSTAYSGTYRSMGAADPDEAEKPRYNACGASALDVDDLPATPPPAGSLIFD